MPEHSDATRIAVLEAIIDGLKDSIVLQAKEYERRLTELNHAHARATTDAARFVTAELFYSKYDELAKWRSELDQWRSRVIGIAIGAGLAAGGMGGLVTGLLLRLRE